MTKENLKIYFDFLNETFPNAKCALNYSKDYELLIAVMLSAQTTDKAVNIATSRLFLDYPSLESLAKADLKDIENHIAFLGMYRNKAKNIIGIASKLLEDGYTSVPNDPEYLVTLPGVGNKTKNCVLAELYNEPLLAVDTHVQRISKRLNMVKDSDSVLEMEHKLIKQIPSERLVKINHQIIWFGREICKAQNPHCEKCACTGFCSYYKKKKSTI